MGVVEVEGGCGLRGVGAAEEEGGVIEVEWGWSKKSWCDRRTKYEVQGRWEG